MSLGRRLRERIRASGPISFAEFMEIALYGPGGFYEDHPVGERGDFVTSPHVHPAFAALMAEALGQMWKLLGRPEPFRVLELGAGDGTLARPLRHELEKVAGGIAVEYTAVERSPGARRALQQIEGLHVLAAIEATPTGITGCVLANELLDNLPFHWIRGTARGPVEVCVDWSRLEDRFLFVERPWPPAAGLERDDADGMVLPARKERAVPIAGYRLVERLARVLRSGYALFVDYARPVTRGALVHGYRAHRVIDAEELLRDPGSSDVTAAVDFDLFEARARAVGFQTFVPVSQRAALHALGYGEWERAERQRQAALQDARAGRDAVRLWSDRNAAALLVHPRGLGGLRWLVVGTPGLPPPPWLSEAIHVDEVGDQDEDAAGESVAD
jgi:SAM-dependent MidA family methyltransferase